MTGAGADGSTRAAVTVVIPVFEQAAFLPAALGSLRAQTRGDWVAVVLDDGSRDGSRAVADALVRGDPRFTVTGWADNRGLGATLNAGLDAAATDLVAYLPADDVWYAEHLATLLPLLERDAGVALAWSGVHHHDGLVALDAVPGHGLQLVQAAHRRGRFGWVERVELESDDLERLGWGALRTTGSTAATGTVTARWTDHPGQRHKAIRESFDGGLNVLRSRYRIAEPLRFHSTDSGLLDEVTRYRRYRERSHGRAADGLRILLVGELALNPDRVLALTERGHELHGLWTTDGLGDATVGPLPFGHVSDVPRDGWRGAVRALAPDVVYALLNWRAVPFAHTVRAVLPELPFVWHFKESPQRSVVRGEWPLLADLVTGADACLLSTDEERDWFRLALEGRVDPDRLGVLDGDLPKADWHHAGGRSPKLSERDGEPHTVVAGRPSGLDRDFVVELTRNRVHVHLVGQVAAPGPKGSWRGWLDEAMREAPGYVHVHPAVGPEAWVTGLSAYDAGWLHRFRGDNGGDLRRATWDDLNAPARLPVYLAAGLPMLQPANPGSVVSVERVLGETATGLLYEDAVHLAALLHAEVADPAAGRAAWAVRPDFTFDAHADRLVEVLRAVAERRVPPLAALLGGPRSPSRPS